MSTKVIFRHQRRLAQLGAVMTIATMCIGGSVMAHVIVHTNPVSPGAYIGETEKNVRAGNQS